MNILRKNFSLIAMYFFFSGFVHVSAGEPRLTVTQSAVDGVNESRFVWDGSTPKKIEKLDKFEGGVLSNLPVDDVMEALLQKALEEWNRVPGTNIRLLLEKGPGSLDKEDLQNSIIVADDPNLSSAAFAKPYFPDDAPYDGKKIVDCDISIKEGTVSAKGLLETLVHELGHCLGLGHAHTNYKSIMGYSRDVSSAKLGADDMAGILYLYPKDEGEASREDIPVQCGVVGAKAGGSLPLAGVIFLLPVVLAFIRRIKVNRGAEA